MRHCIFKSGVSNIDFSNSACSELFQQLLAYFHCIRIHWLVNYFRIIRCNCIAKPCQCIPALCTYRIEQQIFLLEITVFDQFHNVRVIPSGKSSVSSDHNNCLLSRFSSHQERMVHCPCFGQHRCHRIIHAGEICLRLLRTPLCPLQLYSGYQLHRFRNLLCTLYRALTPFDVSHGSHKKTPFLSEDISEISS